MQNKEIRIYTEEQLMARLKFFIGVCLALTLTGIVFVVLYSIIFVTQPLNAMSPIDQKFFELIVPIATFLTGTLSGIMLAGTKPEDQQAMLQAQKQQQDSFRSTIEAIKPREQPVQRQEPVLGFQSGSSIETGFGGRAKPPQAPQPEI